MPELKLGYRQKRFAFKSSFFEKIIYRCTFIISTVDIIEIKSIFETD